MRPVRNFNSFRRKGAKNIEHRVYDFHAAAFPTRIGDVLAQFVEHRWRQIGDRSANIGGDYAGDRIFGSQTLRPTPREPYRVAGLRQIRLASPRCHPGKRSASAIDFPGCCCSPVGWSGQFYTDSRCLRGFNYPTPGPHECPWRPLRGPGPRQHRPGSCA
jgi:hypothetical protein